MQLEGRSAIVTGAASGLGAEVARQLAAAGAKVAVLDVNLDKAQVVAVLDVNLDKAQVVADEIGGIAARCDVTSSQEVEAAIASARAKHGLARILINCAGIGGARRLVGKNGPMPLEEFTKIVTVNLIGTFNVMRLAAPDMLAADPLEDGERGVMVNTSSVAAYDGQIGQAAYAASKGGIASLTLPLARDLAQFGVRVVAIAPGLFLTPLLFELPKDVQDSLGASIPFPKRLGKPSEFAALALHVVENLSLNGEVIRLDGALRLPPR